MMRSRPLLFFLFILFLPTISFAQEGQAGTENSLLPEINPQDIEIRSEFQARFPGLRRQPILGFNPKPRVFQIDPNRMPFMESREDAVASISVTELGRPEPPARSILTSPDRINAYIRAGLGSFLTPEMNGYGFYKLNEKSQFSADMDLRASNGHLENQESGFRYLDLNGRYITKLQDDLKLTVHAGALSDFNYLYNLEESFQQNVIGETSDKTYTGGSGRISLRKMKNTLTGWDFSLGGNLFSTTLDAGNSGFSGELNESQLHSSFSYFWPGQRMYETFDVSGSIQAGNYENSISTNTQSWIDAKAAFKYERLLNFTTGIKAIAGVDYISDPFSEKFYFAPELEIKHNISNSLSVTGTAFAKPEMQTVQEHHQYNRFLDASTQLRHSYNLGASGEVNLQLFGGNRIFGGLNYTHTRDYAFYQRGQTFSTFAGNILHFYNVNYGDANIFEIYAGASQQLVPEKFWADARIYARSPKLKQGGTIPYEEKIGIEGALSYKPVKTLTINGWAEYIGARESPETNSELNAFALLNAGVEYQINETFGVYAKLLNILGQEYEIWDGYQERPFQMFGGLTIKF